MTTTELSAKSVKELRNIAKEMNITGRWDMNRTQLVYAIERAQLISEAKDLGIETAAILNNDQIKKVIEAERNVTTEEEKTSHKKRGAKKRKIEVYKDGQLIQTIDGLMETFNWVTENKITNVGWVKRSLKTGEETAAGYKYREGVTCSSMLTKQETNEKESNLVFGNLKLINQSSTICYNKDNQSNLKVIIMKQYTADEMLKLIEELPEEEKKKSWTKFMMNTFLAGS